MSVHTKTHYMTESAVFARSLARDKVLAGRAGLALLRDELLHGVAAQDAFVSLFDNVDDFESMMRDAVPTAGDPFAKSEPFQQRARDRFLSRLTLQDAA